MALRQPLYQQPATGDAAITYAANDERLSLVQALFRVEGVIDPQLGYLKVSQRAAGANFSVDINTGWCVIDGDDVSLQGSYLCTSSAVENRTIPAAPGSGTRVHRVIARVKDKLHNASWTTYEWTIDVLADVGSGTPAEPATAITLALVSVSAGQSSVTNANITDKRPWASTVKPATGTLTLTSNWTADDAGRPPSYRLAADGLVTLHGFARRINSNLTASAGGFFDLVSALPSAIVPVSNRDMIGACSEEIAAHYLIRPTGALQFRMVTVTRTFFAGTSWLSLDGMSYRLTA